jgi:glycosyltransferase involved in cell wall biosynthesis
MTRSLKITGSYKGTTGHDHHTRSIVRELDRAGIKIQLNDFPEWSPAKLPLELRDAWFEQFQTPVETGTHLFFCMPHQVQPDDGSRIVNYTMFEADRIPELWVTHSKPHDLIIVPVNSCREAWMSSGVPKEKLVVCPLGVDSKLFDPKASPRDVATTNGTAVAGYRTRFLNVSDCIDRKNLPGLLRVWLTATKADDDAVLILKPGFHFQGARQRFGKRLRELENSIGKRFDHAAPMAFIDEVLCPADMPGLYTAATHYVSASRGEGFDLPMLEAAMSGLQLIAPRHTAYLDYLHDDIAHLVSVQSVKASFPEDPATEELFAGARWWEPDQDELCATFRMIIDGKEEKKSSARNELSKLSWANTANMLEQIIFRN